MLNIFQKLSLEIKTWDKLAKEHRKRPLQFLTIRIDSININNLNITSKDVTAFVLYVICIVCDPWHRPPTTQSGPPSTAL